MTDRIKVRSLGRNLLFCVARFGALSALLSASCLQPAREMAGLECDPQGGCSEGYVCHEGLCVRPAAVTDAGVVVDSGGVDRPGQDAALSDGSVSQPDAFTVCNGNDICEELRGETEFNCSDECYCGDGVCSTYEEVMEDCAQDCAAQDAGVSDLGVPDAVEDARLGDAVAEDASSTAVCGNSVVEPGETCDPGPLGTLPDFWGCVDCQRDPLATCIGTPQFCARSQDVTWVPADFSSIQLAVDAAAAGGVIFVSADFVDGNAVFVDTGSYTIVGEPGAAISNSGSADLVSLEGDAEVTLVGLRISNNSRDDDPDLTEVAEAASLSLYFCDLGPAGGLCVDGNDTGNPVKLRVLWSRIHDCETGGVDVDTSATFYLRHNFIYSNGMLGNASSGSELGGVSLHQGSGTFAFNTVVGNKAQDAVQAGVYCSHEIFALRDSIIWDNAPGDVDDNCHADNRRNIIASGSWSGTLSSDPLLLGAPSDLHIDPSSLAVDRGQLIDPTDYWDIDGQLRPMGGTPDVGADEAR